MKKRYTFYQGGQYVDQKDLNRLLAEGEDITLKSKAYVVQKVTETGKNEYNVEVTAK